MLGCPQPLPGAQLSVAEPAQKQLAADAT